MKKYKKFWYEVFISEFHGIKLLKSFDTLKKAKYYADEFLKKNPNYDGTIGIDKWETVNGWKCYQSRQYLVLIKGLK